MASVNPVANKKDTYVLRWEGAPKPDGTRTQHKRHFKGGVNAARKELSKLIAAVVEPPAPVASGLTFGQWLTQCQQNKAALQHEVQTVRYWATHIRSMNRKLGDIPLARLTADDIQAYYTWAAAHGRVTPHPTRGAGLSRTTLHHQGVIMRCALRQAVKEGLIPVDPTDALDQPKMQRQRRPALQATQVTDLLGAVRGTDLHVPALLSLYSTLRQGEVLALRWKDVSLVDQSWLRVDEHRGNAYTATGGGMAFKAPKSRKGVRTVPLSDVLVAALTQLREREQGVGRGRPEDLVVCRPDGRPMRNSYLITRFAALRDRLDWPEECTFQSLRRTCATVMAHAGVAPSVLQDLMGHEDSKTTLDFYTGIVSGAMQAAVQHLGRFYGETE